MLIRAHFVDMIPQSDVVKDGHLYISLKYNMTLHRCASGCEQLVPLPLSPTDWSLTYDGESVSLSPSVGNGALACRAHYLIRRGKIVWLPNMSTAQTRQQQDIDADFAQQYKSKSSSKDQTQSSIRHTIRKLVDFFKH